MKYWIALSSLLLAKTLLAAPAESPKAWAERIIADPDFAETYGERLFHRVVFLNAEENAARPWHEIKGFNGIGYMTLPDLASIEWSLTLNQEPSNKALNKWQQRIPKPRLVSLLGDVDGVVFSTGNGWRIFSSRTNKAFPLPHFDGSNVQAFYDALTDDLGYDGVVLEQKGDRLLVASIARLLKPKTQALVLANSADKIRIDEGERAGAGILELDKSEGPYATFRVVIKGKNVKDFEPGTKVSFERKTRS